MDVAIGDDVALHLAWKVEQGSRRLWCLRACRFNSSVDNHLDVFASKDRTGRLFTTWLLGEMLAAALRYWMTNAYLDIVSGENAGSETHQNNTASTPR